MHLNSKQPQTISLDTVKTPSHGKRKLVPLAYDETGLRTTKTATWEAVEKSLAARALPDHLPAPEWTHHYSLMVDDRLAKGLPLPIGQRQKLMATANYNQVRW